MRRKKLTLMRPAIISHPVEARDRISELGLDKELLIDIARFMGATRANCTENDPPSAPGFKAWSDGTRRARELFCPLGWERCEDGQLSSVINRVMGIRLIVMNADGGTGVATMQPQNQREKRSAHVRAVEENQAYLFDVSAVSNVKQPPQKIQGAFNWYLFVFSYRDSERDILRAELSLPAEIQGGFFISFHERIMLLTDEDNRGPRVAVKEEPPSDGGFEIRVVRKSA